MSRYIFHLFLSLLGVLATVWAYVLLFPMAFMDPSYASIQAILSLGLGCRPVDTAFFGDSRVQAGIVPSAIGKAVNLGVPQGTAIEMSVLLHNVLSCPTRPKTVVIAIAPRGFEVLLPPFWTSSLGYGLLSFADVAKVERVAGQTGDRVSLSTSATPEGLEGPVRDWLYSARFPSFYFSHLVDGRIVERLDRNKAQFARGLELAGFYPRPVTDHYKILPDNVAHTFAPTPLLTYYFDQVLDDLQAKQIPVALITMPIRADTMDFMGADFIEQYFAFLQKQATVHPNVFYVSSCPGL